MAKSGKKKRAKSTGSTGSTRDTGPAVPTSSPTSSLRDALRVPAGVQEARAFLEQLESDATPSAPGDKTRTSEVLAEDGERLAELQERLYAAGKEGDPRRVLVVLQGMDTSGKGGVIRHVFGLVDPQGLALRSFKAPTDEEKAHDFLWRIRNAVPGPGMIGIFDRSHYEDVLVVRVHDLVPREEWEKRYDLINEFEAGLAADGVTVLKCFLDVSLAVQKERLLARLDDPTKHWKYNPGDVDERALWPAYQEAYVEALGRCNTADAPWYAVPADRKWYRNWAVGRLLLETLTDLDPQYPATDIDVAAEKARLA